MSSNIQKSSFKNFSDIEKLISAIDSKKNVNVAEDGFQDSWIEGLPESTKARFKKYNIDISKGYPQRPPKKDFPTFIDDALALRNEKQPYVERGANADPEKKALFGAATEVRDLTKNIGTEISGLQLNSLTDSQKDELALLVAERVVVLFKDQDLDPKVHFELGQYYGRVDYHTKQFHIPGLPGTTVIWADLFRHLKGEDAAEESGAAKGLIWHTDLAHELQPPGITHLHNDSIPDVGGDTSFASGYAAYDKLSPAMQEFLEGKFAFHKSDYTYIDRENPLRSRKVLERAHPIIRTHPATNWKSLFVNKMYTTRIVGLNAKESDAILQYLFSIFEENLDIQVRINWKPSKKGLGTSVFWDNRVCQHYPIGDYTGYEPRHGVRTSSIGEIPYFDPNSKSQKEALGLK